MALPYAGGLNLTIGGAGNAVDGVVWEAGRLSKGGTSTTLKWIGATGGDAAMLSIRNAQMGAIRGLSFDAQNKADYCVQIKHVTGDVNVAQLWDYHQCTFTAARKYNVLIGEVDGTASTGDELAQNFYNCFFRRDSAGAANTTAHVRIRSANTFAVNFFGCHTDHGTKPTYGVSLDSGWANFYGHTSVGTDTTDIFMETVAATQPPVVCAYGWESQNTNFMRANVTGGATVQRSTVLSGVKHGAIAGTPGDAIQWNQAGGLGGLVLHGCRFDKAVNIQSATAKVWSEGVVFADAAQAFTTNPQVVQGSWDDPVGRRYQIVDGAEVLIAQKNSINQIESKEVTVANDGVIALGSATMAGFFFVTDNEGGSALYALRGGSATVEVSDTFGIFSPTAGTATSTNIYWSAGNARYELENKRGASRNYRMTFIGAGG